MYLRSARLLRELLGGEGRDLDAQQAARLEVLTGVAQKGERVLHAAEAQKRVEGADGEFVSQPELRAPHVAVYPLDRTALLPALFDHPLGELDDGASLAVCEGEPESDVVVVGVFEVEEVG